MPDPTPPPREPTRRTGTLTDWLQALSAEALEQFREILDHRDDLASIMLVIKLTDGVPRDVSCSVQTAMRGTRLGSRWQHWSQPKERRKPDAE